MLLKLFVCSSLILLSLSAVAQDSPDLSKEANFHDIYKKYNEQPTPEETWEHAVGERKSQVYRVQKGDTLSDISRTLFGDQFYWPKIWSLNTKNISNPHEIDPSMNIQFFPGSVADAPTLDLVDASSDFEKNPTPPVPEPASKAPGDVGLIPKPKKSYAKPLKKLPPSLAPKRYGAIPETLPTLTIDVIHRKPATETEYLTYTVMETPPVSAGKIVDTELGMKTASEFQYVIVHLENDSQKDFVVYSIMDPVKDPTRDEGKAMASLIEYQGEIQVLEKVNAEENLYRALVKKAIEPIETGSQLLPGKLPTFDPSPTAVEAGARSIIIGGQYASKRELLNTRSLIFLSGGSDQGIREGQSLPLFINLRKRLPKTKVLMNDRQIGVAKVVRVSPKYSTAYVLHSEDDISVGDYAGSSQVNAMAPTSEEDFAPVETSKAPISGDEFNDFNDDSGTSVEPPPVIDDFEESPSTPASPPPTDTDDSDLDF